MNCFEALTLRSPKEDRVLLRELSVSIPRKTNVEFVTASGPRELRVRFWERGVGPTRASGTGAASAAVAAILKGLTAGGKQPSVADVYDALAKGLPA